MLDGYVRLARYSTLGLGIFAAVIWLSNAISNVFPTKEHPAAASWPELGLKLAVLVGGTGGMLALLRWCGRDRHNVLAATGTALRRSLQAMPTRQVDAGIALCALLSIVLELAVIRWHGSMFEMFAFYKNFSLLACFLGLGLGYALATRPHILLPAMVPWLAWQVFAFLQIKTGPGPWHTDILRATPVTEQLNMGLEVVSHLHQFMMVYVFLGLAFVTTALLFVPIGQLCGTLMGLRPQRRAYGLNLLGSLGGVAVMHGLSQAWTPPVVWFSLVLGGLLLFHVHHRGVLRLGAVSALLAVTMLGWPARRISDVIYSPYQHIERSNNAGTVFLNAGGHYFQQISDFSHLPAEHQQPLAMYYELPFRLFPNAQRVAVVGAGTGNDVAAALRRGVPAIDAVEIDPAIYAIGLISHPERPYWNPGVTAYVDDARSFFRSSIQQYDLIVYGLLDSHTLLSHASSVRVDSFVYTVEGFREARARLTPGGALSVAFANMSVELGRKMYLMMQEAFDGRPPLGLRAADGQLVFLSGAAHTVTVPQAFFDQGACTDITARFADPRLDVDPSTDDWPFFYMPRRVYPTSYVVVLALLLLLSLLVVRMLYGPPPSSGVSREVVTSFLLGAGFMLVETRSITELGLVFGNTWEVVGYVIAGIMVMGFAANAFVARARLVNLGLPFALLLGSLVLALQTLGTGSLASTPTGRLAALALATLPLLFSGVCFSVLIGRTERLSAAMAANIFGAMTGGLLEYNSMYFGFRALHWLGLAIYAAAMVTALVRKRPVAA